MKDSQKIFKIKSMVGLLKILTLFIYRFFLLVFTSKYKLLSLLKFQSSFLNLFFAKCYLYFIGWLSLKMQIKPHLVILY